MQGDIAPRGAYRILVGTSLIRGVGRHDERFARPIRIGVLTVHLLEALCSALGVTLGIEQVEAFVVELVRRLIKLRLLLVPKTSDRIATTKWRRKKRQRQKARELAFASRQRSRCKWRPPHGSDESRPRASSCGRSTAPHDQN